MKDKNLYLHVGCHFTAPKEWINIEASPFLYLQKIPFLGKLFINENVGLYPQNVKYGDIVKGVKFIEQDSCKGIYCSHVLEHLPLQDFRKGLKNLNNYLQPNGLFRLIVPDLEWAAKNYLLRLKEGDNQASLDFCDNYTYFGTVALDKSIKGTLKNIFGTSKHHWMWDFYSLSEELKSAGFKNIRRCSFNDSEDSLFKLVEEENRFIEIQKRGITPPLAVAIECTK
ncbi:class I SAM-dependent methyltransferase [Runella salmonicolor]|uniref:Methyltransferase domain-containing protein n=1 Tax=Runella salmonicolor TaxID=2950278 RepID=A0ABT1FRH4_9BACT|nr:methyltransferase domain-containing protein [Runella salmonicolor]MCP1384370.1 methyltransferase domain-containing protein [Runella salmonicolor]